MDSISTSGVNIKYRKIYSSLESDMHNAIVETNKFEIKESEYTISQLSPGQQYYFSISYVGENDEEGAKSKPIYVPLAG